MNSLKLILALFWAFSRSPSFATCPEGSTIQEGACAVTQGITTLNAHGQCIRLNNTTNTFFFIPMRLTDWQSFNANLPSGVSALPCTCTDGPVTWTEGGNTCTGTVISVAEGGTSPAADSGAPTTGTASFICSSQTWVYQGGTCVTEYNQCPSGATINWSVSGRNCSATTTSTGLHNAVQTVNSLASGPTGGEAQVTCNDGTWNVTSATSCDNYCTGGVSGTQCSVTFSETPPRTISGGSASFSETDGINTANLSYLCEANGQWSASPSSVSCGSSCPAGSSTSGTGGVTTPGCRCDNGSHVWNGTACVACPFGTSTSGAGGDASPTVCKCDTAGHTWNGSSCEPPSTPGACATGEWCYALTTYKSGYSCSSGSGDLYYGDLLDNGLRCLTNPDAPTTPPTNAPIGCNYGQQWVPVGGYNPSTVCNVHGDDITCPTGELTWTVGIRTCRQNVAGSAFGREVQRLEDTDTVDLTTGTARAYCSSSGWVILDDKVCNSAPAQSNGMDCDVETTYGWWSDGPPSNYCRVMFPETLLDGETRTVEGSSTTYNSSNWAPFTSVNPGASTMHNEGEVNVTCTNGNLTVNSKTCDRFAD